MTKNIRCVGIFDSGQGGLGTWDTLRTQLPHLSTIYLGDNARYPYGTKGQSTVRRYATEATVKLTELGADAVLIACGTASCVAVSTLSQLFRLPIYGVADAMCEEAAQILSRYAAVHPERPGSIAILGTPYTIASGFIERGIRERLQHELQKKVTIWTKACPLFVPLVEEGLREGRITDAAVEHYLRDIPLDTSVVLLACTHFPHLRAALTRFLHTHTQKDVHYPSSASPPLDLSEKISIVDPAFAICREIRQIKAFANDELASGTPEHRMFCTDDPHPFQRSAQLYTKLLIPKVEQLSLSL